MVSDLSSRQKLHGQIRNKRNIRDMKKSKEGVPCPVTEEGTHQRYEQCNIGKDIKKKDEQNEESYGRVRIKIPKIST
jgi:hypothetical protein